MVESSDCSREPEVLRGVQGEGGVVDYYLRGQGRVFEAGFHARGGGVAGDMGALGCAEGGGDGDVVEEFFGFLMEAMGDCFGGVDGAAAADADDSVDFGVSGCGGGGVVEVGDWGVLADAGEGASMMLWG